MTKIVANHLRNMKDMIISPNQCSYILERNSTDNIMVALEMILIRSMKGNKGFIVLKIDLEKAYDKVKWDFVRETLIEVRLLKEIVDVVWHYMMTVSMRILWKEEKNQCVLSLKRGEIR